jgi:hypothetical protein
MARLTWKITAVLALAVMVTAIGHVAQPRQAIAQKYHLAEFAKAYPQTEDALKGLETKYDATTSGSAKYMRCMVCHERVERDVAVGESTHYLPKKKRNAYGKALFAALMKLDDPAKEKDKLGKKVKDVKIFQAAMKRVDAEKDPTSGKTFGELLKDGKLP